MNNDIKKSVKILTDAIRNDNELYYVYQANIAMAFKDEFYRNNKKYKNTEDIHEIANTAAKNFLNLWIRPQEEEK